MTAPAATSRGARARPVVLLAALAVLLLGCSPAEVVPLPELRADQRVYDETASSLTAEQAADLERRLAVLEEETGADGVAVVRALDASPEETLEQVEELREAWVEQTGAPEETSVALLVNRDPDDAQEARAGVHVGGALEDDGVPRDEQEDLVEEALVPPLREGDVAGSLAAGVDRLSSSLRDGPPRSAFERWAAAGAGWVPWTGLGLALLGAVVALVLHRRRETDRTPPLPPTTRRPGDLPPAVAGALVAGAPQASAVPAVVLDLAARGAVALEREPGEEGTGERGAGEQGADDAPRVRLRLIAPELLRDEVERAVWAVLAERAEDGVVPADELPAALHDGGTTTGAVRAALVREGWWDEGGAGRRRGLGGVAVLALLLGGAAGVVGLAGGRVLELVAVVPLLALAVLALGLLSSSSRLTSAGQRAAVPWRAYRDGLRRAADDDAPPEVRRSFDLDAALPDVVALGLQDALEDRLDEAAAAGSLRALAATPGAAAPPLGSWGAFSAVLVTGSSTATTVSAPGASGGGGAAGST